MQGKKEILTHDDTKDINNPKENEIVNNVKGVVEIIVKENKIKHKEIEHIVRRE